MNYFDELLNSYQLLKKRKFHISPLIEQQGQYGSILAAVGAARSAKLPSKGASTYTSTNPQPVSFSRTVGVYPGHNGGGISSINGEVIPGTGGRGRSMSVKQAEKIMATDPENAQKLDAYIAGIQQEQDPNSKQEQDNIVEPQMSQPQGGQEIQPQPEIQKDLPLSQDPRIVAQLQIAAQYMEQLKGGPDGSFIPEKSFSFWDLNRILFSGGLGSLAGKLDSAKQLYRAEGGRLKKSGLPPELTEASLITFNKFLEGCVDLMRGNMSLEKAETIKDLIKLKKSKGKETSDVSKKRGGVLLRTGEKALDGLIIRWDSGTSFFPVLFNAYEKRLTEYLSNKEDTNLDNFLIEKGSITSGGKNYGNIRGTVAEKFQPITVILQRGLFASITCGKLSPEQQKNNTLCKDSQANKQIALNKLRQLYSEYGQDLTDAFEVLDAYLHEEVPGTTSTEAVSEELASLLNFVKEEFPRKLQEGIVTDKDRELYSATAKKIIDKVISKLLAVDAKTIMFRNPYFAGETGQLTQNSKKTDMTEVYETKKDAVNALIRSGYDKQEALALVHPFKSIVDMYGGAKEYMLAADVPQEKMKTLLQGDMYTLLNGIKTYIEESDISLGSGSFNSTISKISSGETSIQKFAAFLSIDLEDKTLKNMIDDIASLHSYLEDLKMPKTRKEDKGLSSVVKEKLQSQGLIRSYYGFKGSQKAKMRTLSAIQRAALLDKFEDIKKKNPTVANKFMALIFMSNAAAEVNQQTEARYLNSGSTFSFDHNQSVIGPIMKVIGENPTAEFVRDERSGTVKIIENGEVLLYYNTAIDDSGAGGVVHLPLDQVKKRAKKRIVPQNQSTDILLSFLSQQKKLIESLMAKYQ